MSGFCDGCEDSHAMENCPRTKARPRRTATSGEGTTARDALEAFAHGLRDDEAPLTLHLRRGRVEAHGKHPSYDGFVAERLNSDPHKDHAYNFGKTYAERMLKDYIEKPRSSSRTDLASFKSFVPNLVEVNYFTACTWDPAKEEKQVARDSALRTIELVLAVAQGYASENKKQAEGTSHDPAVLAAAYKMAARHDTGCECEVCVAIRGEA